jgi:hypothetical protein
MDWNSFAGPIWVSIATIALYYCFLIRLMRVKIRLFRAHRAAGTRFDRYGSDDPTLRAADRTQLNMLEHMPPFFVALWLHAWVVSPGSAALIGGVWVGARAAYPLVLGGGLKEDIPRRLFIFTFIGYAALWFMLGGVAFKLLA